MLSVERFGSNNVFLFSLIRPTDLLSDFHVYGWARVIGNPNADPRLGWGCQGGRSVGLTSRHDSQSEHYCSDDK
jgi:hypothetical protein